MHTNSLWKLTQEEFKDIITSSKTMTEVLVRRGLGLSGGNYATLHKRAKLEGLDLSDLKTRSRLHVNQCLNMLHKTPEEILVKGGAKNNLRGNLIKIGRQYICEICGQKPEHMMSPLTLPVDHINGDSKDHRPENLRFLCPNCHSQTDTYAGRNTANGKRKRTKSNLI